MQTTDIQQEQDIYTVSRLNNEVRYLLEESFPLIWVEGEISNFAAPNSGHWYFSLKDPSAQVRCAMFRGSQRHLGFVPKDGMHVLIKARVSLYPNRGEYQLIAEQMEERGEGKLRRAFELLKKKLEADGLFDPAHKKMLPAFPAQIGIVTSSTGAAIRDILTVLKRRYPCASVIIYPTLVQGDTAAPAIVKAIQTANRRAECDILIVARGGGSLEDLWPFNEEMVAHAIYQSRIPVISGVGHEVDFTIADFVADQRAPTPSAAAEIATPDRTELRQALSLKQKQIGRHMQAKLASSRQHLHWMQKHLYQQHPKRRLAEKMQRLDFAESSLIQTINRLLNQLRHGTKDREAHLLRLTPAHRIRQTHDLLIFKRKQFNTLISTLLAHKKTTLAKAAGTLDALSPLATLQRGFAIATTRDRHIIRSASAVCRGDEIQVRLTDGILDCLVE
ncbi:Exodeoxyribonuclease 7 large subunit [Aquicella siphonis]|uniref:Exodeoxyribonuclease 7 large subunit n=1 Tax=Aquicella siphonis TaxID=254247 RepID=A0A5E4PIX4_9COXI|nr:exodeoxyribonuclease VII large subunit [Aquicella siphonis]VVC76301.1 Exodeoxyribonuclease 7 large subunit [Aquicella siphonis]